ncbi:MAG: M13 family metallopeptidase [bacterium]
MIPFQLVRGVWRTIAVFGVASAANAQGPRAPVTDPRDTITSFAVGGWGLQLGDRDLSIRPGDDFARYQNGRWIAETTREGLERNNSYWRDLMRLPARRLVRILRELADDRSLSPNTAEGKAAAFYRAAMDSVSIKRKGLSPLDPALRRLRDAKTHRDLARVMGTEAGDWTPRPSSVTVQTFPLALFAIHINQDPRNATRNAVFVSAAGLLLPAPSNYSDPKDEDIRQAYVAYIAGMLRLVAWPAPEQRARDILALEARVAAASWSLEQLRDVATQVNPMRVAELRSFAPGFDWSAFLTAAGLGATHDVIIDTKNTFPEMARIFAETPVDVWKARQAFAILDQDAPKLSDDAAALALDFRSRRFQGNAASQPREFRIMLAADASIPDIIGGLYAKRYFPPHVRAATEDMARRIRAAFDARLASSPTLSDTSRRRARAKLAAMQLDIGSSGHTRDYAGLAISDTDFFGNIRRARAYEWRRQTGALAKPFDRNVWPLQPHNANYSYLPTANAMEIAASALEPPFFDITADPAVNYGAIGTLIGAQMAAAFDRNGRQFGANGGRTAIFTPDDVRRLDAVRDSLAGRLSLIEAQPGLHLQGALIADEITDDIVGIQIALDAYHSLPTAQPATVLDGTTADQRFFLGRAQMWRAVFVPNILRALVATGRNTPPPIRINTTARYIDAWFDAFDVQPGQALYLEPRSRLRFLF